MGRIKKPLIPVPYAVIHGTHIQTILKKNKSANALYAPFFIPNCFVPFRESTNIHFFAFG